MEYPIIQPGIEETNLPERSIEIPPDDSLPAAQVLQEREDEVEQTTVPRFIP